MRIKYSKLPADGQEYEPKQNFMSDYSYVIKTPFTGRAETMLLRGMVYAWDENTNKECLIAPEEYLKANPGTRIISSEEYQTLHTEFNTSLFHEISEEDWTEALECLPPLKWHSLKGAPDINVFFCSEAWSGSIHGLYLKDRVTKKFYSCRACVYSDDKTIYEKYRNEIK